MENRIEVEAADAIAKIKEWYRPADYQLVTVAALDTGAKMEFQWIFGAYGKMNELTIFRAYFDYDVLIPTLTSVIPSAWIIEREIVDLFGVKIEGAKPGLMLDSDSVQAPLRKKAKGVAHE
jgi:NADH:ubiquinone oxidoreductase subunit C